MTPALEWEVAGAVVALLVLAVALWSLGRVVRAREHGRLVYSDLRPGPPLRSTQHRLVGRPDELRRLADGRPVPVEVKSRNAPARGPAYSHIVQLQAYCLLVEDATGLAPPYGLLRYADGSEFRVPWDRAARQEVLSLRRELERPYDGRATPAPHKCRHCPWVDGCDARSL